MHKYFNIDHTLRGKKYSFYCNLQPSGFCDFLPLHLQSEFLGEIKTELTQIIEASPKISF